MQTYNVSDHIAHRKAVLLSQPTKDAKLDLHFKTQQASSTFQSAEPVPTSTQALDDMKEFSHSALVNLF